MPVLDVPYQATGMWASGGRCAGMDWFQIGSPGLRKATKAWVSVSSPTNVSASGRGRVMSSSRDSE